MTAAVLRLCELAGPSLADGPARVLDAAGPAQEALRPLFELRNGFYAFESAPHVFPDGSSGSDHRTIGAWNDSRLWRDRYGEMTDGLLFFAEDAFGGQFALDDAGAVVTFDPETGATDRLAATLDGWAQALLDDGDFLIGHTVARAWQQRHGPLQTGHRLLPTVPFVLGGEFVTANLNSVDAATGMRLRADIARQIHELPDGTTVRFTVAE